MGKSLHHYKSGSVNGHVVRWLSFAAALLLTFSNAHASNSEFELFDKGYEYYLAYQPDRAVLTFRTFLSEFPESSAKDAAMFWLAKSLSQTGSVDEAKKVFSELRRECPESPFIPYLEKEAGGTANFRSLAVSDTKKEEKPSKTVKLETAHGGELKKADNRIHFLERELAKAVDEKDKLAAQAEEEKNKAAGLSARITELEKKESEAGTLLRRMEEGKKTADEIEKYRSEHAGEKEGSDVGVHAAHNEMMGTETVRRGNEGAPNRTRPVIIVGDNEYTAEQVIDFMFNSSSAMAKAGIREILWRNGSLFEDFINEQVLYDQAERQNLSVEPKMQEELIERFKLTAKEAAYIRRYLVISELVGRKVMDMPEERVVESLSVRYTGRDREEKVVLANELQAQAKAGKSFEEIYKMFPDKMVLSTTEFQELQGWIKERIELLRDGEVSVVWTKDGYMILRPMVRKASYRPFEDVRPGRMNEIKEFVKAWTEELRKGVRKVGIAYVN